MVTIRFSHFKGKDIPKVVKLAQNRHIDDGKHSARVSIENTCCSEIKIILSFCQIKFVAS